MSLYTVGTVLQGMVVSLYSAGMLNLDYHFKIYGCTGIQGTEGHMFSSDLV